MSRYLILGALLAIATTVVCMRILAPDTFHSFFNSSSSEPMGISNLSRVKTEIPFEDASPEKKIQVALILDTSNSMDGLIEQTKSQLWKMVNALAEMEQDGTTPVIEIALLQYGNDFLMPSEGYVQLVNPLTEELDDLSEQLFQLTTNGGSEFCGYAIREALGQLTWSPDRDDLRIIFIAGNEPFTQGPVAYQNVCKLAKDADIILNTVYCGGYEAGVNHNWKDPALMTGGQYMNIDQADQVRHIETPFDDKILELNEALNKTYIYYGQEGYSKLQNLQTQDANAGQYNKGNSRTRAIFKSKKAYKNTSWDLVDYTKESGMDKLKDMKEELLPLEMQQMDIEERQAYVKQMQDKRSAIQKEIRTYETKVKAFISAERSKEAGAKTLDNVLQDAITEQAANKNFSYQ
jgi:hypothetical protein